MEMRWRARLSNLAHLLAAQDAIAGAQDNTGRVKMTVE